MAPTRDADWWPRLDAAFQGALELPEGERARYLDRVCGADRGLRTEVDEMLAADGPEHALEIERLVHDGEGPRPTRIRSSASASARGAWSTSSATVAWAPSTWPSATTASTSSASR